MKIWIIAVLALFSVNAHARCDYTNLAGSWTFILAATDFWSACDVRVKGDGTMHSGECVNSRGEVVGLDEILLKTDGNCLVDGYVIDDQANRFDVQARINLDKSMIMGVGLSTGIPFTFNGTKL